MEDWEYEEICIGEVRQLLDDGYEIEVDSPDGYVGVNYFVDKGDFDEYVLLIDGETQVRCNYNHLFETPDGWQYAEDLVGKKEKFLTPEGWVEGEVIKTGEVVPIVDINVNHENHRYYTNNVSSHNTGGGKSLVMCHMAANYISRGFNCIYISLELSEEMVSLRIDANLMNTEMHKVKSLDEVSFGRRMKQVKDMVTGKLFVMEYPTSTANVNHFRHLLSELELKKNFKPDVIFVDYLNICASSRVSDSGNSYHYVKAIAEELRGLAVETNTAVVTASQLTRTGYTSTDVGLEDISESFGTAATADLVIAVSASEEMQQSNMMQIKQLKNRFGDPTYYQRFVVGCERSKMKIYDLEQQAQEGVSGSGNNDNKAFEAAPKSSGPKLPSGGGNKYKFNM